MSLLRSPWSALAEADASVLCGCPSWKSLAAGDITQLQVSSAPLLLNPCLVPRPLFCVVTTFVCSGHSGGATQVRQSLRHLLRNICLDARVKGLLSHHIHADINCCHTETQQLLSQENLFNA